MDLKGMTISEEMTTPTRPGKKPRQVWVVRGATAVHEGMLKTLGGRKYNGAWSFWGDPTEEIAEALAAGIAPTFAQTYEQEQAALRERRLARAERREGWAESAERKSDSHYQTVRQIGDRIPLGQPILVGHHSERHARRDVARMDSNMRKSVENADKAREHSATAARLRQLASDAPKSPTYIGNRIREAKAQIAVLERSLQGKYYVHSEPTEISDRAREHYSALLAKEQEKLAYWQTQFEAVGGNQYSKANVVKGDKVMIRGEWRSVARANATTVSVTTGYSWTDRYPYAEIRAHERA